MVDNQSKEKDRADNQSKEKDISAKTAFLANSGPKKTKSNFQFFVFFIKVAMKEFIFF